jgi:putative acetyltransferase
MKFSVAGTGMRSIPQETPTHAEVQLLLRRSDEFSAALYPPESRHLLDVDALAAPEVRFFVARVDKRAVGCGALVLGNHGKAEIKRMFVDPTSRGKGIGRALLDAIEETARREGVSLLQLETGMANHVAMQLYRCCGYRERGAFGSYGADPLSVFMEKRVRPPRAVSP